MKGVCLLSGGIDSAVAAYLMDKKGDVVLLNLETSSKIEEREKIKKIARELDLDLYSVKYDDIQKRIADKVKKGYICIVCKRMMLRIAEAFCRDIEADFLITGEELGQVASQTLRNLTVLDEAVNIPVIRPLISWNREDIINKAKEIGTYELSTLVSLKCTIVPESPTTSADIERTKRVEEELGVGEMIDKKKKEVKKVWEK